MIITTLLFDRYYIEFDRCYIEFIVLTCNDDGLYTKEWRCLYHYHLNDDGDTADVDGGSRYEPGIASTDLSEPRSGGGGRGLHSFPLPLKLSSLPHSAQLQLTVSPI